VEATPVTEGVQVTVQAGDPSGLYTIMVAYTTGDGYWHNVELVPTTGDTWQGTLPISGNLSFFVQVVDMAGNVAVDDNYGLYYGLCAVIGDVSSDTPGIPDGIVNAQDLQALASRWRMRDTDANWNPRFDQDKNGVINTIDIMRIAAQWGETCP